MDCLCITLVTEFVVHVDHIECALVVDYVVPSLVNKRECVLMFTFNLSIAASQHFVDIWASAKALLDAVSKHDRVLTIVDTS